MHPTRVHHIFENYEATVRHVVETQDRSSVTSSDFQLFCANFSGHGYLCRFISCAHATTGFSSNEDRQAHESGHTLSFPCPKPECQYPPFGSHGAMRRHLSKTHEKGGGKRLAVKPISGTLSKAGRGSPSKELRTPFLYPQMQMSRRNAEQPAPATALSKEWNVSEEWGWEPSTKQIVAVEGWDLPKPSDWASFVPTSPAMVKASQHGKVIPETGMPVYEYLPMDRHKRFDIGNVLHPVGPPINIPQSAADLVSDPQRLGFPTSPAGGDTGSPYDPDQGLSPNSKALWSRDDLPSPVTAQIIAENALLVTRDGPWDPAHSLMKQPLAIEGWSSPEPFDWLGSIPLPSTWSQLGDLPAPTPMQTLRNPWDPIADAPLASVNPPPSPGGKSRRQRKTRPSQSDALLTDYLDAFRRRRGRGAVKGARSGSGAPSPDDPSSSDDPSDNESQTPIERYAPFCLHFSKPSPEPLN